MTDSASREVWTGLDPGGVEYLWQPDVLVAVLEILSRNSPFDHRDSQSPIYPELLRRFPGNTWYSWDKNGEFRPIFRRSNPWVRLGLVADSGDTSSVTSAGDDLLMGSLSIEEVLLSAVKNHRESNDFNSFARLALALLSQGEAGLSIEQILQFLIPHCHEVRPLAEILSSSTAAPDLNDRRRRSVTAMMNVLVSTGGVVEETSRIRSWRAIDQRVLSEIARADPLYGVTSPNVSPPISPTGQGSERQRSSSPHPPVPRFQRVGRPDIGDTVPGPIRPVRYQDPLRHALLLERANRQHQELVIAVSNYLEVRGLSTYEDPDSFDLAVFEQWPSLVEVKSIHKGNAQSQLRKAVSQLLEYRWRHGELFEASPRLLVVTNLDPSPHLLPSYLDYLREDLSIQVFWEFNEDFLNSNGESLGDFD